MSSAAAEPTVSRFPIRAVSLGIAAMVLIAIASAMTTWVVGNRIRTIARSQVSVITASERLQRQGESMELLAQAAIGTPDPSYRRRYRMVRAELDSTLRELERAIQLAENRAAFARVQHTLRQVAAFEERALATAQAGRSAEAGSLLQSARYQQLLGTYREGLREIEDRARTFVESTRLQTDRYLAVNLAASLIALLMIGLAWLLLVRPARSWARELRAAHQAAETATRAKSDFLAVMSHEIRTPLNSILGFSELLLGSDRLGPEERHQAELIQNAGAMLLTVVNDLLDFSKIEAGKIELHPEPFAVEMLVDNSVSIVRGTAEAKGLEMRVAVDPCLDDYVLGDETRLRQVLLNLLNNAVKFTNTGLVSLAVARPPEGGDWVRFTVTDTGVGISVEQQSALFEPFAQADASITRRFGGTGLGLSISKRLVELMGGEIGLLSNPGAGSSFWFQVRLPRTAPPKDRTEPSDQPRSSARILLAEDLPMNQELACAILRKAGHSVDVVADGEEAVRAVQRTRYDLVLMDIQMPHMDGITATRAIRALPGPESSVPILAMTANVLPEQVRSFLAAGMNGHVAKPIEQRELHRSIAATLAGGRPDQSATREGESKLFDRAAFDSVAESIPPESLDRHARSLHDQAGELARMDLADRLEIETLAHKIVSQAGMLGLIRMSRHARRLEEAARSGADLGMAMTDFRTAACDVERFVLGRIGAPGEADRDDP